MNTTGTSDALHVLPPPPAEINAFAPSAARARYLDLRMRYRLAESLRHIVERGKGALRIPSGFSSFIERIQRAPVSPLVFNLYSDSVLAIENDNLSLASDCLAAMLNHAGEAIELAVKDLGDPQLDPIAARYSRVVDTDDALNIKVFPPSPEASAACRSLIARAFKLMDRGDAELAAEIRALLREIILGAGSTDKKAVTFDGASAFMLWGAVIINAIQGSDELAMVQMLAHESAHNLLFGLSADESLVENQPEETYKSPLRQDPRPMDGIYHATFVTARMHRVVRQLLASGILTPEQSAIAEKELSVNKRLFESGMETVEKHGILTALGREVMDGACRYMAA